jgi:hypothetical protein
MNFDLLLKLKSSYHSYIIRTALFFLQNDIIIIIYSTVYTVYIYCTYHHVILIEEEMSETKKVERPNGWVKASK